MGNPRYFIFCQIIEHMWVIRLAGSVKRFSLLYLSWEMFRVPCFHCPSPAWWTPTYIIYHLLLQKLQFVLISRGYIVFIWGQLQWKIESSLVNMLPASIGVFRKRLLVKRHYCVIPLYNQPPWGVSQKVHFGPSDKTWKKAHSSNHLIALA